MTRGWTNGSEAADGRVSVSAAACYPSRFARRTRLEAENLLLRQQLVVLRRKSPTRVRLWNIETLKVAERAGVRLEDIALIVPHQANLRILNAVADRLSIAQDKVFTNIDRYGNTSAASVPIALDEAIETNRIRDNDLVMLNACGGGLTWGANLLRW